MIWDLKGSLMSIKSRAAGLFKNTGFILALAFAIGLALPRGAARTEMLITPLLAMIITLSIMGVSLKIFFDFKNAVRPVAISLLLNYAILSLTIIGLANLLIADSELRTGLILLAAVPPAIAVIPFTYRLDGDVTFSLLGTVAAYIAALFLTPLISINFLGTNVIQPTKLLITLAELIAIPLGIAQILRRTGAARRIEKYRGSIVNWSFFVVIYTIVGLNQSAFLEQPLVLLRLALVAFISIFVLGWLTDRIARARGSSKERRISMILTVTRKNYGLAASLALALFSPRAALPSAMATIFAIGHFIWLSLRVKKMS